MVSSDLGCSSSLTFCNGRADWPYVSRPNTTRYEHIVCVLCAVLCCLCGEVLFLWLADFWGTRRRCRGVLPPPPFLRCAARRLTSRSRHTRTLRGSSA